MKLYSLLILLFIANAVGITHAQFVAETGSWEEFELKGRVKQMEVTGLCQGPVTSVLPVDTSLLCQEVYEFNEYGKLTYFASYDKFAQCMRRVSYEYDVDDHIILYVNYQFGDTLHYLASYNLLGQMLYFGWKKNGRLYQEAHFEPMNRKGEVHVQYFEKDALVKEIVERYNKSGLLIAEDVKDLKTGKVTHRRIEYMDSLILLDDGPEQVVTNKYDAHKRGIYSSIKQGENFLEMFFTYNEDSTLATMIYLEAGKGSDKYVYESNDKKQLVSLKQYFDEYTLMSTEQRFYDEAGNNVKIIRIENYNTVMEKTTEILSQYDHEGNWIEQLTIVKVGNSSNQSVIKRKFTYY